MAQILADTVSTQTLPLGYTEHDAAGISEEFDISEDPTASAPSQIVLTCLDEEDNDEEDKKVPVSPITEVPSCPSNATLLAETTSQESKASAHSATTCSASSTEVIPRKPSLSGNKFRFSSKEVETHRRRSSEKRYRVPEFEDHLKTNLGENVTRRKSSGNKYVSRTSKKTVLEIILSNNPGITISRSVSSSRKHSLRSAPASGERITNLKALEEAFGNTALDQAAASLGNSFSASSRARKASSANSALLNHGISNHTKVHNRKMSSPAILEKRVLQGLPIAPELTIPNIHIPSPKEDLGEVVMDGSIKAVVKKVLQLD